MFFKKKKNYLLYRNNKIKIASKKALVFKICGVKGKLPHIIYSKNIYIIKKKYVFILIILKIWYTYHLNFITQIYGIRRQWKYSLY